MTGEVNGVSQEYLGHLRELLRRFFETGARTPETAKIETELVSIRQKDDAWRLAIQIIQTSSDPMLIWFAASTIESFVKTKWNLMPLSEKAQLRTFILQFYLAKYKIAMLLILFAKMDWPESYPDFIQNLLTITQNAETSEIGVKLIKLTAEEFSSAKEDLLSNRKAELKALFINNLQTIIDVLAMILTKSVENKTNSPLKKGPTPFDAKQNSLCMGIFEILTQLFSWIPLQRFLSPQLMDLIFQFIMLNDEVSISAFACINEILAQNYLPVELNDFLLHTFLKVFTILDRITANPAIVEQLDAGFLNKLTEFTSTFVTKHFHRVESNPVFPILDFLALLFKYTFIQNSSEDVESCLEIWQTFLDYTINQKNSEKGPSEHSLYNRYVDGLMCLYEQLSKFIQYQSNSEFLSQLFDEQKIGTEESELDFFLKNCFETIAKITDLYPNKVIERLYPVVMQQINEIFELGPLLSKPENAKIVFLKVLDFITNLRLIGRLEEYFVPFFAMNEFRTFYLRLLELQSFLMANSLFDGVFKHLQAQVFGTIQAYSQFLLSFFNHEPAVADALLSKLLELCITPFGQKVPEEVALAAANALKSVSKIPILISKPQITLLIGNASLLQAQPINVQESIFVAVISAILAASNTVNTVREEQAKCLLAYPIRLLNEVQTQNFANIATNGEFMKKIEMSLQILSGVINSAKETNKICKQIVFTSVAPSLHNIVYLFQFYFSAQAQARNDEILNIQNRILQFFIALFGIQSADFISKYMPILLEALGGNTISHILTPPVHPNQMQLLEAILEMFQLIVTQGAVPKAILEAVTAFVLQNLLPPLKPQEHQARFLSIAPSLYNVLYHILLNNVSTPAFEPILAELGSAFQKKEIPLFKQNLEYFEALDKKCGIYAKWRFTEDFIMSMLNVLVAKTHDLLRDEIIAAIYNASCALSARSDSKLGAFFKILPNFLQTTVAPYKDFLLQSFTADTDVPTFSLNMNRLIADTCYFLNLTHQTTSIM